MAGYHSTDACIMLHRGWTPNTTLSESLAARALFRRAKRLRRLRLRAEAKPEDSESAESLFAKELKRRGIEKEPLNPTDKTFGRRPPPKEAYYEEKTPLLTEDQFRKARALSSEGLEGFIPRAKELLTLAGTFTLSFIPSIAFVMVIAAALYLVSGQSLVHFGNAEMTPPSYVNPYELLDYPYNAQ